VNLQLDGRPCRRFCLCYLAALLVILAASLLVACGGGDKEEETASDKAPQAAATAAASPAATPEEEAAEVTSGPAEAFAELESYRMKMSLIMEGTTAEAPGTLALDIEGAFVAPDRSQTHVTAHLDDLKLEEESITVGEQTWVKTGDNWVEGEPEFKLGDFSPGSLVEELGPEQLRLLKPSNETVNGVDTLRYDIDRADVETLRSLGALLGQDEGLESLPEDFNLSLWLAEDGGWPVRITVSAQGVVDGSDELSIDLSMDVTDVNDPDIEIEPPA
jgi:hypothetical protein